MADPEQIRRASDYVLRTLLGRELCETGSPLIHYGTLETCPEKARVVIVPADHFWTEGVGSITNDLPLPELEGVPILFGSAACHDAGGRIIVEADIIASSFFLLTRFEELQNRKDRDCHGRFPGRKSLPYRGEFLERAIVDEYGDLLFGWLRSVGLQLHSRNGGIRKVYLTHDVDTPYLWHKWRFVLGETRRKLLGGEPGFVWPILNRLGLSTSTVAT